MPRYSRRYGQTERGESMFRRGATDCGKSIEFETGMDQNIQVLHQHHRQGLPMAHQMTREMCGTASTAFEDLRLRISSRIRWNRALSDHLFFRRPRRRLGRAWVKKALWIVWTFRDGRNLSMAHGKREIPQKFFVLFL